MREEIVGEATGDGTVALPTAALEARVGLNEHPAHRLRLLQSSPRPSTGSTPSLSNSPPEIRCPTSPSRASSSSSCSARSGSGRSSRASPHRGASACSKRSPRSIVIPNHVLWRGRQAVHLADASYDELKEIAAKTTVNGAAGTDLQLLLAITSLWGEEARRRLRFVEVAAPEGSSRLGALLGLRW